MKQFDKDGVWKYSEVIELKSNSLSNELISLYPNPTIAEVKLYISGEIGKHAKAEINNIAGQVLNEFKVTGKSTPYPNQQT